MYMCIHDLYHLSFWPQHSHQLRCLNVQCTFIPFLEGLTVIRTGQVIEGFHVCKASDNQQI